MGEVNKHVRLVKYTHTVPRWEHERFKENTGWLRSIRTQAQGALAKALGRHAMPMEIIAHGDLHDPKSNVEYRFAIAVVADKAAAQSAAEEAELEHRGVIDRAVTMIRELAEKYREKADGLAASLEDLAMRISETP